MSHPVLLRPCSHPGCPVLVPYGRCSAHTYPLSSLPAPLRSRFSHTHKPFYNSRAWKLARLQYLALHPICETCRRAQATEVHHKLSLEEHWELRLEERNFEAQCKPCHSKKTVKGDGGFGRSPGKDRAK